MQVCFSCTSVIVLWLPGRTRWFNTWLLREQAEDSSLLCRTASDFAELLQCGQGTWVLTAWFWKSKLAS